MGFMDKLRDTAQKGVDAAQKGASEAREKASEMSLKRKFNQSAEQLGLLVFRQREGEAALDHHIDPASSERRGIRAAPDMRQPRRTTPHS